MSKLIQANVVELEAPARQTATFNTADIDLTNYSGPFQIILTTGAGGGTTPTLNVKLQDATASGGAYADITGAVFAEVTGAADSTQMITLQADEMRGFLKVVGTITGTSPTFDMSVVGLGCLKAGRNASQAV